MTDHHGVPSRARVNALTERIIGSCIEIHRELGPRLLESVYEECLCFELADAGIGFERQVSLPVAYKGVRLDCGYRMDVVADDLVVIELKSVEQIAPIRQAQMMTYLKLSGLPIGLLINFNVPVLKQGIKRIAGPAMRALES